jgi:hypothetical protein
MQYSFGYSDYLAEAFQDGNSDTSSTGPSKGPELVFWKLPNKRRGSKIEAELAARILRVLAERPKFFSPLTEMQKESYYQRCVIITLDHLASS